ncbi:polysialyltransferase family glycosyltransferase [Agarivorans sp. OAG1]|uniref:polysialyltransferase family glycosyltransferase n=1 Tax=Agarivorans sp. OAG1 TaxID=3082387 RepID=UPI0030D513AD
MGECILALCRGLDLGDGITKIHIPDYIYYHGFNSIRKACNFHFLRNEEYIKTIDEFLLESTGGDDFVYFTPHCRNPLYQIFITNKSCKQVHYIEDGMDAYLPINSLAERFPFYNNFIYEAFNYLLNKWFKRSKVTRTSKYTYLYESIGIERSIHFCITKKSFLHSNCRLVLKPSSLDALEVNLEVLKFKQLLLLDAVVEQGVVKKSDFSKFIFWFFSSFTGQELAVKFHPVQDLEIIDSVKEIARRFNIELEILSDTRIIELDLLLGKELKVHGIGSSLLSYAALNDMHEVYVYYDFFEVECGFLSPRLKLWNQAFSGVSNVRKYKS